MKVSRGIIVTGLIALLAADGFCGGPGTSAASFLKIDAGARPVGMGGAFCAVADDLNAVQWNPAGLVQLKREQVLFSHNEWIEGVKSEFVGYARPVDDWAFAFTVNYLHMDDLVKRDILGNTLGSFGANSSVASFAAAMRLRGGFSLGGGAKIIREAVAGESAAAYAFDLGGLYRADKFKIGAALQNAGSRMKLYEEDFPLPVNIKLGLGYEVSDELGLALDVNRPADNDVNVIVGSEYLIKEVFTVRGGFKTNRDKNTGSGIAAGFGFKVWSLDIDYALDLMGELGQTHRFSLLYQFGGRPRPGMDRRAGDRLLKAVPKRYQGYQRGYKRRY